MPVAWQYILMWFFIAEGVEQAERHRAPSLLDWELRDVAVRKGHVGR